jgi:hypothetical protein
MTQLTEFRSAVAKRRDQLVAAALAKNIERTARLQAAEILKGLNLKVTEPKRRPARGNGLRHTTHKKMAYTVSVPARAILCRGPQAPDAIASPRSRVMRQIATLAWNSLAPSGKFRSGRASRDDMTRYLQASLPNVKPTTVSPVISIAVKKGVLQLYKD